MKKFICKISIFILLMTPLCFCLNKLLAQKWSYEEDSAATQIATGFYEEPENSLDVLYFGLSTMRNGISPLTIWNSYGITGYSRASSIQSPLISYYLLEESLKTQSPKVVVVEASPLIQSLAHNVNDYDFNEGKIHEALDNMRLSWTKQKMAEDISSKSGLSVEGLLFPLYRYHDRWQDLDRDDFSIISSEKRYAYKGNYPATTCTKLNLDANYMANNSDTVELLSNESAFYTGKMADLCKKNGIEMVLLCMPTLTSSYSKNEVIQQYADSIGVRYLDLNLPDVQEEMGFSVNGNFIDSGSHLNIHGSNIVSQYVGQYLCENFDFIDKRTDASFSVWDDDYRLYEYELENFTITGTNAFFKTIDNADKERYIVVLSGKYDISEHFNSDVYGALHDLGLQYNMKYYPYNSYIAIIDGNSVITEQTSSVPLDYSYTVDGLSVNVHSQSSRIDVGSSNILIDGEEYSNDYVGINLVIYDKELGRVIKSATYNTGKTGIVYARPK